MKNLIKLFLIISLTLFIIACGKSNEKSAMNISINRAATIPLTVGHIYKLQIIISGVVNQSLQDTFTINNDTSSSYSKEYPTFEFDAEGNITIQVNILYDTIIIASGSASANLVRGQTAKEIKGGNGYVKT